VTDDSVGVSTGATGVACWPSVLGVELVIKRSRVRLPVWARLRNNYGQVVHTIVSLSPSITGK